MTERDTMDNPTHLESTDIEQVRAIVVGVAHYIDKKNWALLRTLYADTVTTDYTSLFGGTTNQQSADDLIAGWRGVLSAVKTQHLLGPIHVEFRGEQVSATCHVRAMHFVSGAPGGEVWEVLGHYVFSLSPSGDSFQIHAMKLETFLQTGNKELLAEAASMPKPQ